MAFIIIPHFLPIPRGLGRPRRLTRVLAPSVGRDILPLSTTALCRERSQVEPPLDGSTSLDTAGGACPQILTPFGHSEPQI